MGFSFLSSIFVACPSLLAVYNLRAGASNPSNEATLLFSGLKYGLRCSTHILSVDVITYGLGREFSGGNRRYVQVDSIGCFI